MARQRISATELAKTFNATPHPVYVLDDEGTVVFCNRACRRWLGEAAEGLIGQSCVYRVPADSTGPEAVAACLSPPPEAMAGREMTAAIARSWEPPGPDGRPPERRRARFIPLSAGPDDLIGLVVIVDVRDLDREEPSPATEPSPFFQQPSSVDLHEQVREFRAEAAGRCRADRLVGESPAMRRARAQIELALGGRQSVLLVGPPGSGRQHVAAAIHYGTDPQFPFSQASLSLSSGSLVPLSCSVLAGELIRSTVMALAGMDRSDERPGPRTLLLNEADQIPAALQSELAAELASRSFSLRLIASAERALMELAREGRYSAELAAVLSTITIELPPLPERRRDIPLLAQLFVGEANAQGGRQLGGFTAEALDALDAHPWPGNVDELVLTVAQAHRCAEGPLIDVQDLPERIHLAAGAAAHRPRVEESIVLDEFLARIERELIERALARAKGNKAKAARLLGMNRPRLYRRLVQLGLEEG